MIPCPQQWSFWLSGETTIFAPPDPALGLIRYRERVRPPRRMPELLALALPELPEFRAAKLEAPAPLITLEGEYAALQRVDGFLGEVPARRYIGGVFAEDMCSLLDALVPQAERFDAMEQLARDLLRNDTLGLGMRRRRFLYAPPLGWRGTTRGLSATWYPPEYPLVEARMHIPPAEPLPRSPSVVYTQIVNEEIAGGLITEQEFGPDPIKSAHGLRGSLWYSILIQPSGNKLYRYFAALLDERHSYTVRLFSSSTEQLSAHYEALLGVVNSAHPIPAPEPGTAAPPPPEAAAPHKVAAAGAWAD